MTATPTPPPTPTPAATSAVTAAPALSLRRRFRPYPIGLAAGVGWGVAARLWMRWVSTTPEFSWSGTIFIVGAFGVFGLFQANAWASRRRDRSRTFTTIARVFGWVGTMPLFFGAGAMMLPTVLFGSLARWRNGWPRPVRVVLTVLASVVPVLIIVGLVDDFGIAGGLSRGVAMVGVYAVVVGALAATFRPRVDGWRLPRRVRAGAIVGGVVAVAAAAVGTRGFG